MEEKILCVLFRNMLNNLLCVDIKQMNGGNFEIPIGTKVFDMPLIFALLSGAQEREYLMCKHGTLISYCTSA